MPKATEQTQEEYIAAAMADMNEIRERSAWRRNVRGNLTRTWTRYRVTVFRHRGAYGWSIHDMETGHVRYAEGRYQTENEAMDGLALAVVRGY